MPGKSLNREEKESNVSKSVLCFVGVVGCTFSFINLGDGKLSKVQKVLKDPKIKQTRCVLPCWASRKGHVVNKRVNSWKS